MQSGPIEVGSRRQLFLDDYWFAGRENAGVHYSTVIRDGGRYRMWYRSDGGRDDRNR